MENTEIEKYLEKEIEKYKKSIETILQLISDAIYEREVNEKIRVPATKTITQEMRDKGLVRKIKSLTCQSITEYEKRKVLEEALHKINKANKVPAIPGARKESFEPVPPKSAADISIVMDVISNQMNAVLREKDRLTDEMSTLNTAGSSPEIIMREIHDNQIVYSALLNLLSEIENL